MRENKVIILVIFSCLKIRLMFEFAAHGSWCNPHQRVRSLISYCCACICTVHSNLLCHMWCQAYVLWQKLCAFLRPLDFGWFTQWSLSRDCKWLWLQLMVTLRPCRYMLYSQAMILVRSGRLGGLAFTSVDGCYIYIIIHYCISHVTWL